ncbi:MAG: hypothetical protein M3362_18760, partial [Acidobacteriota bacterium]|nr:hypothetical protein [Acidobacteriota bacterium]
MRIEGFVQSLSEKKCKALTIVSVLILLSLSQSASAQSGRKNKNVPQPQPPVASEPQNDTPKTSPPKKSEPLGTIIVGGDKNGSTLYSLAYYVEDAVRGCMDRIK